ncbi:MAG: thermonuclease family protein [Rhizobiales bacterium]|jgi:endonuclease YncB( thermonuclease family)|nr:thermonuclease family protein [Hyphomicrobiales bacterium]
MFRTPVATVMIFLSAVPTGAGSRMIDGPVAAEVVRVIDGDTVLVEAMPWPDHKVNTYVRLRGIDAPELRSKCPAFRKAAQVAKSELASLIGNERLVQLTAISGDKYFGRVVADLTLPDGTRPAEDLLEAGLVDPYSGRTKSKRLCPSVMKDR